LATRMDKGFITNSTGNEGTDCKVCQLIMQFIVTGKDKTTKRAGKAMVCSEGIATAITVRREIWGLAIQEEEIITNSWAENAVPW